MQKRNGLNPRIYLPIILLLAIGNLALVALYVLPALRPADPTLLPGASTPTSTPSPLATLRAANATPQPGPTAVPVATQPSAPQPEGLKAQGALIFSMSDGHNIHLFAYNPQYYPLTRLSSGPWDDTNPSISPDGKQLVYTSRQNGYSDLYILDLISGATRRVTDSPEYEGAASWSSDGKWLAIEKLVENTLQIVLLPLEPGNDSIQLTSNPDSSSYAPAWSPQGRTVAFVSAQTGKEDVWLARLDRVDDRFLDLTQSLPGSHRNPQWSPDGKYLAWSSQTGQGSQVRLWDSTQPNQPARVLCPGENPAWNSDGTAIAVEMRSANQDGVAAYRVSDGSQIVPLTWLPGALHGLDWVSGAAVDQLLTRSFPPEARASLSTLWQPKAKASPAPLGRSALVTLDDVVAPYPYLQDSVDDSFIALRQAVGQAVGWDFLANLESAYTPLTVASDPGMFENWLYTGRAIGVNALPIPAGWMAVVREEIDGQTYWRIYLHARYQDGSQGAPLTVQTWDLNARSNGSTSAYEAGGQPGPVPQGYWVDFTELAQRFGWERLPSLVNWRTYYPAIRFNVFVQRGGLEWQSAMSQLYPPEALSTPTPFITATITPSVTRTPWYYLYLTQSVTPSITPTPTLHPTLTPLATQKAP